MMKPSSEYLRQLLTLPLYDPALAEEHARAMLREGITDGAYKVQQGLYLPLLGASGLASYARSAREQSRAVVHAITQTTQTSWSVLPLVPALLAAELSRNPSRTYRGQPLAEWFTEWVMPVLAARCDAQRASAAVCHPQPTTEAWPFSEVDTAQLLEQFARLAEATAEGLLRPRSARITGPTRVARETEHGTEIDFLYHDLETPYHSWSTPPRPMRYVTVPRDALLFYRDIQESGPALEPALEPAYSTESSENIASMFDEWVRAVTASPDADE
jgi:hypothetical protein